MEHNMNLVPWAYNLIKTKSKDIEVRLNDEKRQLMNIGDIIVFTNIETGEQIKAEITNRYLYDSFEELFNTLDHKRIGIDEDTTSDIMNQFYTQEDQERYKALGLELKLID